MRLRLYDDDGVDTRFGAIMRTVSLLIAILSGVLLLASPLLFLMGVGVCLGVNCDSFQSLVSLVMELSPLLFLMAMAGGFAAFNGTRLSARMIVFTLVTAGAPVICAVTAISF
jgi:uncharacterized membrane protein